MNARDRPFCHRYSAKCFAVRWNLHKEAIRGAIWLDARLLLPNSGTHTQEKGFIAKFATLINKNAELARFYLQTGAELRVVVKYDYKMVFYAWQYLFTND